MNDVPVIYCDKHNRSLQGAAEAHGYTPPLHRVGLVHGDKPREGEIVVARVRAGRYSLPIPIFRREVKDEPCEGG